MPEERKKCRLTELTGMPVITRVTGKKIGNVKDVLFDPESGKLDAVTVESSGFFSRKRRFILMGDIRSLGEDAIMLEDTRALKKPDGAPKEQRIVDEGFPLMGKMVITEDGTNLGNVSDVIIDPDDGTARMYEVSGGTFHDVGTGRRVFPIPRALVVGRDALIVPNATKEEMEAQEPGGLEAAYKQTAAGTAGLWDDIKAWWSKTTGRAASATAEREVSFALGKVAGSTVTDDMGNVIVDEGETITNVEVVRARASGKLHQLALAAGWGATKRGYESARGRVTEAARGHEEQFVLGKEVDRTIRDDDGQVIIWKGDVVTQDIVDRALETGKLEALTGSVAAGAARGAAQQVGDKTKEYAERGREFASGTVEKAGEAREAAGERKLTAQQREMALGKVSATDIIDRESNEVIRAGEIFTPMILDHLEEEDLLDKIRLSPLMGPERISAGGEAPVPRIELVVCREEERHPPHR